MNIQNHADAHATPRSLLERIAQTSAGTVWVEFVSFYQPFIGGWLRRAGVADSDVDDLSQDILAVCVKDLPTFNHNGRVGAFRCWLRSVVVNRTRSHWRTHAREAAMPTDVLDALADPDSGMSGVWDREHDEYVARQVLTRIEDEFTLPTWQAFRRQVLDGLSATAVATEQSTTVNAVLIAKSRVLRRFREEVAGLIDDGLGNR